MWRILYFSFKRYSPPRTGVIILIFKSIEPLAVLYEHEHREEELKSLYRVATASTRAKNSFWTRDARRELLAIETSASRRLAWHLTAISPRVSDTTKREKKNVPPRRDVSSWSTVGYSNHLRQQKMLRNPTIRHRSFQLTIWCMRSRTPLLSGSFSASIRAFPTCVSSIYQSNSFPPRERSSLLGNLFSLQRWYIIVPRVEMNSHFYLTYIFKIPSKFKVKF